MLRLLTAGKSLVGSENAGGGRYRVNKRRLLPKFESSSNPFSAPEIETKPSPPPPGISKTVTSLPTETNGTPVRNVEPVKEQPESASKSKGFKPLNWLQKGRSFVSRAGARLRRKPVAAVSPRPVVQGELSLDKVKVVRNDLSDTDFEVVAARASKPVATTTPTGLPGVEPELAGATVGGVTFRFFGAEET